MKKLILTSLLTLALAASASAAVPSGGVYPYSVQAWRRQL